MNYRYCKEPLQTTAETNHNLPLSFNLQSNMLRQFPSSSARHSSQPRVRSLDLVSAPVQRQATSESTEDILNQMRMHPIDHHQHMFFSLIVSIAMNHTRLTRLTSDTEVREHLKGKDLSFTEIAKTVGERWQVLAPDDKATYESRSQAMKDHYYAQLAEYKKTQDYAHYQNYLEDFKAKHEPSSKSSTF
jgi:hypothetical protein